MPATKHIRFSERLTIAAGNSKGFVNRRRTKAEVIYSLFLALIMIVGGVSFLVYQDTLMGCFLTLVISIIMYFTGKKFEKMRNLLRSSEFMNAMLTSVMGAHYQFCMIVQLNGDIVYLDRGFYATFPDFLDQSSVTLEAWLNLYKVSADDRQKILGDIKGGKEEKIVISIAKGGNKVAQDMLLYIEPIPRPEGFVLLRGKDA